jgi:hypothetical protein
MSALPLRSKLACEFVHCDSRRANQTAQRSFGNFFLVGNGKSGGFAFSDHDDVASTVARDLPTELFKHPDRLATA